MTVPRRRRSGLTLLGEVVAYWFAQAYLSPALWAKYTRQRVPLLWRCLLKMP